MQIHSIDLEFQGQKQVTGAYFIDSSAGGILIETGPATTLPALLTGLDNLGVKTADIKHVLVTHIHFDHAGASGWWAQQGAHIYMHHFGAPHMVNPARLVASATRIYGDQMEVLWGDLLPIPKSQMTALNDNDVIEIGDVTLTAWDTPGHAWHHHCYVIDDIAFTGDVAAVKLPNSHLISLPAPPPDFHRERWLESLDRVQAANFRRIYLTHFGAVDDVSAHLDGVRALVDASATFIQEQMVAGRDRDAIMAAYETWTRQQALAAGMPMEMITHYEAANPIYMSVDGLMRYWRKRL